MRSGIAGEVVKVYKRAGESVKQSEPILRVANRRRVRIEGLCRAHQADLVRVGMPAAVEPDVAAEPLRELSGHTGAVTALAVSSDGKLIASAGEDRTVHLWAWPEGSSRAVLQHSAEVFAVAFAPAALGANLPRLLTGSGDGLVRTWVVPTRGGETPTVWVRAHDGPIRALAVSPDGRWCATGGEDRSIVVWEIETGAVVRRLCPAADGQGTAHQGTVTSLQFTADGHLISTGRDNVLQVWRPTDAGSGLVIAYPGRTGEVTHVGVSPDGRHVLFDQGDELRILDRDDGTCLGNLRGRRQGRFLGVALFSPGGRLVVAGGPNGRVQLWKAPILTRQPAAQASGGREEARLAYGSLVGIPEALMTEGGRKGQALPPRWGMDACEIRHYAMAASAALTCAAFSPDERVVFTGGTDKLVRAWPVPPATQWERPREARITYVGSQVERGTDRVRVCAELENPEDAPARLRAGMSVDIRCYPEETPR